MEPLNAAPEEPVDSATGWSAKFAVVAGLVVVVVLAVGYLVVRSASDPTVELEERVSAEFDERFVRATDSWCAGGCSGTGHEWHADGELVAVADEVAAAARMAGAEATVDPGAAGATIVRVEHRSVTLLVGVTDGEWVSASPNADGVSIWFTSVTVMDR